MARKPKPETPADDDAPLLSLVDQDAPEGSALVVVDNAEPPPPAVQAQRAAAIVLQNPQRFDQFYDRIRERVSGVEVDLTTDAGRRALASEAFKVTKLKTSLMKASTDLTEDWRRRVKAVNDARKPMIERLDALADEVRQPLTDWENAEKARQDANATTLQELRDAMTIAEDDTSTTVEERGRTIHARTFEAPQWTPDEAVEAVGLQQAAVVALVKARNVLRQKEADAAELAELRRQREEREAQEAAERAAKEAAEREAAEAKAAQEAAEAEARAAEQREREAEERRERERQEAADKARREAEEAAAERERQREAAHAAELAAAQADRDRVAREAQEAEERREREERERQEREAAAQRQAEQEAAEAAEALRQREADKAHRRAIMAEAVDDIMAATGLDDRDVVRKAVLAIAAGNVRNLSVTW